MTNQPTLTAKEKRGRKIKDVFLEEIREKLAELEHDQWISWTNYLVTNYIMPKEIVDTWRKNWKPYSELTNDQKYKDRIWADKVIAILKDYEIYPF